MTTQGKIEVVAPGHVYVPSLGTGIELTRRVARLHVGGEVRDEQPHTARSAWAFWHQLQFADVFPSVDAWWFRGAWTGWVRFSAPVAQADDATLMGYVQFGDDEGMPWAISEGDPIVVSIPLPLLEVQPVNMPLRMALARHLLAMLNADQVGADLAFDRPFALRSFVYRHELAAAFPDTRDALTVDLPLPLTRLRNAEDPADLVDVTRRWTLEGLDATETVRAAWCRSMGLVPV